MCETMYSELFRNVLHLFYSIMCITIYSPTNQRRARRGWQRPPWSPRRLRQKERSTLSLKSGPRTLASVGNVFFYCGTVVQTKLHPFFFTFKNSCKSVVATRSVYIMCLIIICYGSIQPNQPQYP